MNRTATAIVIVSCLGVAVASAAPADSTGTPGFRIEDEPTWAVGAAFRTALIPFDSEERTVATFIPFVFYDGRGPFYFRGLEGGVRLWRPGDWQFSAMTRIRFFDIPVDLQNQIQGDTFFYGLQGRYAPFGPWHLYLEVLSDLKGHELANARLGGFWERRKWWAKAYFQAQYKTSRFNTRYYGLELEDAGAGGVEGKT